MTSVHIITGQILPKVIKKVTAKYECNQIFCLGYTDIKETIIGIKTIPFEIENVQDYKIILQHILNQVVSNEDNINYYVCLDTSSHPELIILFMISIALSATSYFLYNKELEIPSIPIRKPEDGEIIFLKSLLILEGKSDSFGSIAEKSGWGTDAKGVARASYIANKLEKDKLITKEKIAKSIGVNLTDRGKLYTILNRI